jgi:hypothetical protein
MPAFNTEVLHGETFLKSRKNIAFRTERGESSILSLQKVKENAVEMICEIEIEPIRLFAIALAVFLTSCPS